MASLGFAGATYMQDVDKTFCDNANIPIGTEGRLIDKRDGKIYWVGKLRDGNCWMTQNLDLDLSTSRALTPVDSDVTTEWIPVSNTLSSDTVLSQSNWPYNSDGGRSYDSGWYVYTMPSNGNNKCESAAGLADCVDKGWRLVDDTYVGYDAHYLAGNYYQWKAAKAGKPNNSFDMSICPKGWKLPVGNSTVTGSFGGLLNGLTSAIITLEPYFYVYGGYIYNGALNSAGNSGYYWSSVADTSLHGYYLSFSSNTLDLAVIGPSGSNIGMYGGFTVRCVAR